MKNYFFCLILLLHGPRSNAQDYDRTVIHAGEELSDYYTFRFPAFQDATLVFKTGGPLVAKVNFNMLLCKMEFINDKGDTLEISKPGNIDQIQFPTCSFIYDKDYFEVIASLDSVRLLLLRKVKFEAIKIGAMGNETHGSGVDTYTTFVTPVGEKQLQLNQDVYAKKKTTYFLAGKSGEMVIATKSGFLKVFDDNKKNIEIFLKSDKINFNRQNDLEKLFHFCIQPKL